MKYLFFQKNKKNKLINKINIKKIRILMRS